MVRHFQNILLIAGVCCGILHAATVSGVVTDSAAGTNLDGVRVQLRSGTSTVATDTTGTDGAYSFAVDTGRYTVRASKTGYVTKSVTVDTVKTADAALTANVALLAIVKVTVSGTVTDSGAGTALAGVVVRLREGSTTVGTDTSDAEGKYSFADVETGSYTVRASLTGYTTKTLNAAVTAAALTVDVPMVKIVMTSVSGTVTDSAAGTALAGAYVQLRSGNVVVGTDTTGTDGKYSFTTVEADSYTVRVSLSGYVTKSLPAAALSGDPVTVDVALAVPVTATVGGTVTDSAAGTALAGAIVQLRNGNQTVATDTSGADGKYSFATVVTDTYTVRVSMSGYSTKSLPAIVASSAALTVDVPLAKPVTAAVGGTVTDSATGTAIAGVIVQLRAGNQTVGTDTTGADGKYSFPAAVVDTYTVRASLRGYATKSLPAMVSNSTAVVVDIQLIAVVTATVSGTVTDTATGKALAGVAVQLRSGNTVVLTDTSGSDGVFSFEKIEVGDYSLRASFTGYRTKSVNASVTGGTAVTANIPLALILYGTITGTVTADSLKGGPLSGVTVVLSRSGMGGAAVDTATTDAQGAYSFDNVETELGYSVRGSKTGFASKSTSLTNKKTGADTVNFYLTKLITKSVHVIVLKAADSTAVSGAAVTVSPSGSSGSTLAAAADTAGKATFENVFEGTYAVSAAANGFTARSTQYTLNVSASDSVKLYLAAATGGTKTITGTIADSTSGTPLAGVIVSIRISGGNGITLAVKTAANGSYAIVGIPVTTAATTISASLAEYKTTARNLALGTASVADTTRFDFKILSNSSGVIERKTVTVNDGMPSFGISAGGLITLNNFPGTGNVRLFGLNGALLYECAFDGAGNSRLVLPRRVRLPGVAYVLRVTTTDGVALTGKVTTLYR